MHKLDGIHPDPWQLVAELRAKYEKLSAENERAQEAIVKWMEANAAATTLINEQQRQIERLRTVVRVVAAIGDDELIGDAEAGRRMARILREEAAEWN